MTGEAPQSGQTRRATLWVFAALSLWLALLLVTHTASRSPYTYGAQALEPPFVVTRSANPDAWTVYGVTRFFYDGSTPEWTIAHNMHLPLHSFSTAIVAAFARPYMLANVLANYVFLLLLTAAALRLGERMNIRPVAMLVALGTVYVLPPFAGYIGQPMQYIVGPVVSFLIVLAAVALPEEDLRNPWIAGALTAILIVNYDWYVYGAALAVYIFFIVRMKLKDALIYTIVAIAPAMVWHSFLMRASNGAISAKVHNDFLFNVFAGYLHVLFNFPQQFLMPFTVSHIGLYIALHQIIAMIYWPLVVCCVAVLWLGRPRIGTFRGNYLVALLVAFFFLEQMATAVFDWENSPRRAMPVVLAFAWAYCWAAGRMMGKRRWNWIFATLLAITAFLSYADVIFHKPENAALYQGDAIRKPAKHNLKFRKSELVIAATPDPDPRQAAMRSTFPPSRVRGLSAAFWAGQAFAGACLLGLLWLAARARLLPRYTPHAAAALWGVSLLVRLL